jgi:hypothetical protein
MHRAVAAILEDRPTLVNDLKLEAAAFLCLARQSARVNPGFVRQVVAIQNNDGGWGKLTPEPDNPTSRLAPTTLAPVTRGIPGTLTPAGGAARSRPPNSAQAGRSPPLVSGFPLIRNPSSWAEESPPSGSHVEPPPVWCEPSDGVGVGLALTHGGSTSTRLSTPTPVYRSANL